MKEQVVAILLAKKDEKVAAVAADFDALIAEVNALPDDSVPLPPEVAELQAKLDAALAEVANDQAALSDELSKEAKLQAKLDAVKAALEG